MIGRVTFLSQLRAGLAAPLTAATTSTSSTTSPPMELASPWADSSALQQVVVDLWNPDELPLTRELAMQVPAVARARNMVAATLGRVRLVACDEWATDANGDPVELPRDHPSSQLARQLDPGQPMFVQITWTADDLIFEGKSYAYVLARYASGKPAQLRRLVPGTLTYRKGRPHIEGIGPVEPRDVIRIDGPHEGILNYGGPTVRAARDLERSAARFAKNPVPAIDLHQTGGPPLGKTDREQLVADWAKARAGANGGVAFTSQYIEAKVLGAPAEHLLTGGRNAQSIDVARVVGVTADAIDASPERASMTYNNGATKNQALIDYGLAAYGAAIEARLSMNDLTPSGVVLRFKYSQLTDVGTTPPTAPAPAAPAQENPA